MISAIVCVLRCRACCVSCSFMYHRLPLRKCLCVSMGGELISAAGQWHTFSCRSGTITNGWIGGCSYVVNAECVVLLSHIICVCEHVIGFFFQKNFF